MAKRFSKAKKIVAPDFSRVDLVFADGRQLSVEVAKVAESVKPQALIHGVSQKVGDSYAGAESVDEAYESAESTVNALYAGEWSTRTPGEGTSRATMLAEALYEVTKTEGKTLQDCIDLIADMDDTQKEGLANLDPIEAAMAEIRARRAAEKAAKAREKAAGKTLDLSQYGFQG